MTDHRLAAAASGRDAEALQQVLAGLRPDPARTQDSMRLAYMRALARRVDSAPASVRPALEEKLEKALAGYSAQPAGKVTASDPDRAVGRDESTTPLTARTDGPSALAQLTRSLQGARPVGNEGLAPSQGNNPPELRSVRGFSETWSKIAAEDQLVQALTRRPSNAGPLNSQMLVLRSLELMRDLSPDYLRRFMAQVDALAWLEQAGVRAKPAAAKAPSAAKQRTARKKG